ncbi:ShlB/FhaC/HecB family hemolysin secretion/activation protein [Steroidobacter sp. S1-65]|uniref:ShlB/FhaC/HecB family hemolysin secretion/activation protein n=1 Tax=Steroidobacter gossypii TaxID=2805490 RepID=A0ABS1X0E7_9GAMM|nr:ShlB/FhaC/HecB family hemolysin secretion/activation protein [Steroidobacter gossypii]MBM0106710.1 ShlB/FhaC/HecB family hemolysin secretion/activation protein [Steroidobacter gossypii]
MTALAVTLAVAAMGRAAAQVPPAATPGGALPRVEPAVPKVEAREDLFTIPRVYDRPLGLDEGPRIVVKAFRLVGAVDRPAHGVTIAEATSLLEAARLEQPPEGFSINQLQEVASKVATYYRERGYILAQAFVPEQEVVGGEVSVQVLEGTLAEIQVEGNRGYRANVLERPFDALLGQPIEKNSIESALLTLTNYPGVTAFGVLGAGREVGTSRLTVRVQSEDRFELETALDNHGSQFAGEYRGQLVFTFNDPLRRADRLQLIGLYAVDESDSSTHGLYGGLDYEIPLFSPRDSLRVLHLTNTYTIGASSASLVAVDTEGETQVDEIGYRHDFPRSRLGSASIGLAFNVKSATFDAPPTAIYEDKLTTARVDAQWERIDTRFRGMNHFTLSYTHGFKDLFDSLDDYDAAAVGGASRFGASGEFDKISLQIQRLQRLTQNTSVLLRVDGQYSDDPLVSLEQFSLGGPNSVRAYSVSEVLAERGGVASVELILGAPGIAKRPAFGSYTWGQLLQLSVFADYAKGWLNAPLLSGQEESVELSGAGGALQFAVPGRVFARLEVATPLSNRPVGNDRDPQFYFRIGASY